MGAVFAAELSVGRRRMTHSSSKQFGRDDARRDHPAADHCCCSHTGHCGGRAGCQPRRHDERGRGQQVPALPLFRGQGSDHRGRWFATRSQELDRSSSAVSHADRFDAGFVPLARCPARDQRCAAARAVVRSARWAVSWRMHRRALASLWSAASTARPPYRKGTGTMKARGELRPDAEPEGPCDRKSAAVQGGLLLSKTTRTEERSPSRSTSPSLTSGRFTTRQPSRFAQRPCSGDALRDRD